MTEKTDALDGMIEQYETALGRQPPGSPHPTWDAILARLYQARSLRGIEERLDRLIEGSDTEEYGV